MEHLHIFAAQEEQKVQAEEQHVEIEANKESGDSQIENEIDGAEVSVESVDSVVSTVNEEDIPKDTKVSDEVIEKKEVPEFYGLNDSSLLQYVEDRVYAELKEVTLQMMIISLMQCRSSLYISGLSPMSLLEL